MSRPAPARRLAPNARALWRLEGLAATVVAVIGAAVVSSAADGTLRLVVWGAALAVALGGLLVVPELRWRRWRWDLGEHDVEIRRGLVTVTHTVVPLRRIQHVDTKQGVLEDAFGLATVVLHTAAGKNEIPALRAGEAADVRDRIAALTRTADEL